MGVETVLRLRRALRCLLLAAGVVTGPGITQAAEPLTGETRFVLRRVQLTGATVLPAADLDAIVAPHLDRPASLDDVEDIRKAVTDWYVGHGFITSGATIPDQTIAEGTLTVAVTEGRIARVDVGGAVDFAPGYFNARLARGLSVPFNVAEAERNQQLLLQNQYVRRLDLDIQPGLVPGEATLRGTVTENPPYSLTAQVANDQSPTVGEVRGQVGGSIANLLGHGDVFSFSYGRSAALDDGSASYSVPIASDDTTLRFRYDVDSNFVIAQTLRPLNIASRYDNVSVGIDRPFWRTPTETLTLGATFERRRSRSYLGGAPYSFVAGSDNGKTNVTVLRLYQDWLDRDADRVIALRSTLSIGVQALGATITQAGPSGQFFAWLGQAQYVRRVPAAFLHADFLPGDVEFVARAQLQLSANPLFPIEQTQLGGIDTVRGTRSFLVSTDNGFAGTIELRVPIAKLRLPALGRGDDADGTVQLAPFYDFGSGWNTRRANPKVATISGIGAGLRWLVGSGITAEVYYGHALRTVHTGSSLEDNGVYFRVSSRLF